MRSQVIAPLLLLAALEMSTSALAASTVVLTPYLGPPSLPVAISGSGFADGEAVDVYVDTVDTLLLVSSATGTLSGSVTIPASAQPGKHYVSAIGRRSGDAAQEAFTVTTPWTEQGFGAAHLGWNPYENTLNTSNVGSLGTLWQINVNGYGGAPAVDFGRVYLGTGSGVEAVSVATGALIWKAIPTGVFYASPTISAPYVYIGDSAAAKMYALNTATGAVIWSQATGGAFESSAAVAGGLVYAGSLDGKVYAFSTTTGKIAWTYTTGGFIDSTPTVVNGVVYIGSSDDSVYALNGATGALIWSSKTGNGVESSPSVSNGVVYVGSDDNTLYAFKATGLNIGAVLWGYATGGVVYAAPAVAYGIVYFGSADGNVYAVNAHSGALVWSFKTNGVVESPAVANGVVYVTSRDDGIYALDAHTGNLLASAWSAIHSSAIPRFRMASST